MVGEEEKEITWLELKLVQGGKEEGFELHSFVLRNLG